MSLERTLTAWTNDTGEIHSPYAAKLGCGLLLDLEHFRPSLRRRFKGACRGRQEPGAPRSAGEADRDVDARAMGVPRHDNALLSIAQCIFECLLVAQPLR